MSDERQPRYELARQVVLTTAAGLAGYAGPGAGALAAGAVPLALVGINYVIGKRRVDHAAETLMDAADAFGAETPEQLIEFIEAAVSDEQHQELLARALTVAQDTAYRDKRRALGRALASAASDTGTKVDDELLFIRVIADLDAPHIRLLWMLDNAPPAPSDPYARLTFPHWHAVTIAKADSGLNDSLSPLLRTLLEHELVVDYRSHESDAYSLSTYGRWLLLRLAEPGQSDQ